MGDQIGGEYPKYIEKKMLQGIEDEVTVQPAGMQIRKEKGFINILPTGGGDGEGDLDRGARVNDETVDGLVSFIFFLNILDMEKVGHMEKEKLSVSFMCTFVLTESGSALRFDLRRFKWSDGYGILLDFLSSHIDAGELKMVHP